MELTHKRIGDVIERLRNKEGITKKELAERTGIDPGNLNRIISGKQGATFERLSVLSAYFDVPVWQMIKEAEGPTGDQRKAVLHDLIDALQDDQVDQAFRRWPIQNPQPTKKVSNS